ncbi:helix-turn-helix transcriptional regulator [Streptomyces sp. NPDC000665]|uniref:helix-turn-helix domain-containing protein n=1 Tax=unclassified Streptomyces TaxID=2593676 RepID=UPI00332940E1
MPYPERALGRLAQGLRNARLRADLTYRQLADRAPGLSRPALQNAASGRTLPTREAVTAYATACDTEPGPLLKPCGSVVRSRLMRSSSTTTPDGSLRPLRSLTRTGGLIQEIWPLSLRWYPSRPRRTLMSSSHLGVPSSPGSRYVRM